MDIISGNCVGVKDGSCPTEGFFSDTETLRCEQCDSQCRDCDEKADYCVACFDFFDKPLVDWLNYKCVAECPAATYFDPGLN